MLAQTLARVWQQDASAVHKALREYEEARMARAAPLVQRAYAMGAALGLDFWPVIPVRELVMSKVYSPRKYLLHTTFNCGNLMQYVS